LVQVVLEGSAEAPSTADGIRVIELLQRAGISFQCVDIGGNENMREALKREFRWERFPQVYAQGELVGDVSILEVHADVVVEEQSLYP
jgi:glutaredoxin-related protein